MADPTDITQLLLAWRDGDRAALDALMPLVHKELHRLAVGYMADERAGHVLQAKALINEAYGRLVNWNDVRWQGRGHFFAMADDQRLGRPTGPVVHGVRLLRADPLRRGASWGCGSPRIADPDDARL
jgi:hypothetical protein